MKYVLNQKESKELDIYNINNFYTSLELMENAGRKIFEYLSFNYPNIKKYILLCGSGNNAGDAYVLGRLLLESNKEVEIYKVSNPKSNECVINSKLYKGRYIEELNEDSEDICYIDAMFGIGLDKEINKNSKYFEVINKVNSFNKSLKISIDIPSGLDSSTGNILGIAFNSDLTLTIGNYKLGLFLRDGKDVSKKNVILDIGFKYNEISRNNYIKLLEINDFKDLLFKRIENSNKGSYGKVSLIGGSLKTPGALKLSLLSFISLHLNVGYSTIYYPKIIYKFLDVSNPEITYNPLKNKRDGSIKFSKLELERILDSKTILIGIGIGISKDIYKILKYLLNNYKGNLIIDADALNTLAKYGVDILKNHKCNLVLTPHIKEFSRLINKDIKEIINNRIELMKEFVNKYDLTLLLKDNSSIIMDKNNTYINVNGNNNLARGGSGDILSGILLGILDKDNFTKRVAFSSYILGRSSDLLKEYKEGYEVISRDIIDNILKAYKEVENYEE